ncbi:translation initiation factor IF-2 isoform X2 [Zalophus californianus]|uniref:Translation initiation factor IF-2 isoform X2 n=1 Tax=Zalophus californianus TaxID=9704 RepID=A0A6J2FP78_ZALCA|nr:translation initiation factor IF-2 isoform X2 [Zalophus californianus]
MTIKIFSIWTMRTMTISSDRSWKGVLARCRPVAPELPGCPCVPETAMPSLASATRLAAAVSEALLGTLPPPALPGPRPPAAGGCLCHRIPELQAAGGAAGPERDFQQLNSERGVRGQGPEQPGRKCGQKVEVAGVPAGETAAGPERRSLGPAVAREAVRVGPAKPELSDGRPLPQRHGEGLLPGQLAGVRGQLLLVLPLREVLGRGGPVLPAGERPPGGGGLLGGAEICPAPYGSCEHLDGPHRPEWSLEMGGRYGLRDGLQELEARAAGRLVRARARGRRGLRALHRRRPLERRRVPETLPLGVRDSARAGQLGASSPVIYFLGASTCPVTLPSGGGWCSSTVSGMADPGF